MQSRVIAGRYELVQQIGRGAMGFIWEAVDQHLRRRVAVKVMSPDHMGSGMARTRFDREAKAIAQLKNPNVVQIHDYGIDHESPFIVMELLEGEDLDTRLERVGRLPLGAVATIVKQAATGLAAAHTKGIIHRDFKPANVFMAQGDTDEVVKVLDFGVVSMLSEPEIQEEGEELHHTAAGTIVGTPLYMSPEQIRGGIVDHRSDLWSLAVVAYRALVGINPFAGQWLGMLMVRICTDPFALPTEVLPELSVEVNKFFEKALAKDPDKRFRNAREFANAFMSLAEKRVRGAAKILVVDDEPDVELLVKQRFRQQIKKSIYDFVFASDGLNALEKLKKFDDIDVILTDINMPGMDGLTFLGHVGEVNPLVRTIVVSAYGDMNNIRTAMNRGAFDFVVKPIDFKDLEVTIEKTLKHVTELKKNAQSSEENNVLRMFVSPHLIDRLRSKSLFTPIIGGPATIAFIDIAGTHTRVTPHNIDELVRTLNANFEVIVPAVTSHGGIVEKFVSDAAMVIFQGDNHAARAVDACLTIRSQLRTLAARAGKDSPFALGIRMGIATGTVSIGEVGSKAYERLEYTLLGPVPRIAAMLEAVAETNQILVDENTHELVRKSFDCAPARAQSIPANVAIFEAIRRTGTETQSPQPEQADNADLSMSISTDPDAATIITQSGSIAGESKAS